MRIFLSAILAATLSISSYAADPSEKPRTFLLSDYQYVELTDLYMNPGKFIGRPIELRQMTCRPVEGKGFACISRADRLIVLTGALAPDREQTIIAERCKPEDELYRQRCKRTIRVVPERIYGEKGEGYNQKIIVKTRVIDIATHALDNSLD